MLTKPTWMVGFFYYYYYFYNNNKKKKIKKKKGRERNVVGISLRALNLGTPIERGAGESTCHSPTP
jgi:hypothetical protein